MSTYRISELLAPRSVVVIGGSDRETSVGLAVLKNIRQDGFSGSVHLVNSKYSCLLDVQAKTSIEKLPEAPDLAVITTPAQTIPELIESLGKLGCKASIIISAD
jgi:acetyltransferase